MKNIFNILKWGILLWLFGYLLGFILFFIVPPSILGWLIMPFGLLATFYVCLKKTELQSLNNSIFTGLVWLIIAILFDYLFIVKLLSPSDGYYKLDVYIYYASTLFVPIIAFLWKGKK